ncbi:MAG TPA: adenylate cyclase [Alphaproteobacteria bacterium]|jgi:DNA segregation ATPase FtsK/SpoIIIE-like protein|nr:adenylate cyclase [Alphaproteobacteria bacterium]
MTTHPAISFAQTDVDVSVNTDEGTDVDVSVDSDEGADVDLSVTTEPPELPEYDQPPMPAVGYIWTPGYWGYGGGDYYWIPGVWVRPPRIGVLWTPPWWGWHRGFYVFHRGYWGPRVGFYGGINYGFGYGGIGFEGGFWRGRAFSYNRAVNNFGNVHVTNVYNKTVINNRTVNRISFNGGRNGINARPDRQQIAAAREARKRPIPLTDDQKQHFRAAKSDQSLRAKNNQGHPPVAATDKPGNLKGPGATGAKQRDHAKQDRQQGGNDAAEARKAARQQQAKDRAAAKGQDQGGKGQADAQKAARQQKAKEHADARAARQQAAQEKANNHKAQQQQQRQQAQQARQHKQEQAQQKSQQQQQARQQKQQQAQQARQQQQQQKAQQQQQARQQKQQAQQARQQQQQQAQQHQQARQQQQHKKNKDTGQ